MVDSDSAFSTVEISRRHYQQPRLASAEQSDGGALSSANPLQNTVRPKVFGWRYQGNPLIEAAAAPARPTWSPETPIAPALGLHNLG